MAVIMSPTLRNTTQPIQGLVVEPTTFIAILAKEHLASELMVNELRAIKMPGYVQETTRRIFLEVWDGESDVLDDAYQHSDKYDLFHGVDPKTKGVTNFLCETGKVAMSNIRVDEKYDFELGYIASEWKRFHPEEEWGPFFRNIHYDFYTSSNRWSFHQGSEYKGQSMFRPLRQYDVLHNWNANVAILLLGWKGVWTGNTLKSFNETDYRFTLSRERELEIAL
jgi:hypothetical protein